MTMCNNDTEPKINPEATRVWDASDNMVLIRRWKMRLLPVNSNALIFSELTGRRSFKQADILRMEKLGYNIVFCE